MNENLYQLKESFLQEWPLSRVQTMTLEEYTNLDKTSFSYWLEAKTENLGSMWGGSAYKFGIYKRRDITTEITVENRVTDGDYAWFQKYGNTKEIAFQTVKNILISIIENTKNDSLENIDSIDLGDVYKWKIAFLYGDFNVLNIFNHDSLVEAALALGYKDKNRSYTALNRFIITKKDPTKDYFEFSNELWAKTSLATKTKYWLYAPGENANKWEEFYSEGIMGLGWNELGDLRNYQSKKEINQKLQELQGVASSKKNDTTANFDFYKNMNQGDYIFVKKGTNELLGYGIVSSDYYYDENRDSYKSCRKVDWKLTGNWLVDFTFPMKTLTDITAYETEDPAYSKYHERIMGIINGTTSPKINVKEEFATWLLENAPESYNFYLGGSLQTVINRLDEISAFFNERSIFEVDTLSINQTINYILDKIGKIERVKNAAFFEYDSKNSKGIPKAIIGKNNYIKFLNEKFNKQQSINYWIFQGSPKIYNAVAAINNKAVSTWTVSAHRDKIKKGDKFILWLTGAQAGCYALGRVESEVGMMKEEDAEMSYYLTPTPQIENYRVKISIEHSFVNTPVLWDMVKDDEAFKDFKGSNQGTNFTATEEQYEILLDFDNESDSSAYADLKKIFDKDKVNSYLTIIRNFVKTNALKSDDPRISFNIRRRRKRLAFLIGNRYTLVIQKRDADTKCEFISKDNLTQNAGTFTNQKGEIEAYWNKVDSFEGYLPKINEGLLIELNRNTKCAARKYTNQDFINDVYQTDQNAIKTMKAATTFPLNQILYGPPGTGKTYTLKNEYFSKYTLTENSISPEVFFEETVSNLTWWQVIALALLEIGTNRVNEILENRWVAKKAQLSESKNVRATIWGALQMHTLMESTTVNYTQRQTPFIFNKTTDKKWELHENELKEQEPELYDTHASVNNFKPSSDKEIKHYVFTTFHQSFSYEDFIEGIKPVMEEGKENVTYKIENGIFRELCLRAQNDPNNRYAIFIDEINRGNISQIFGELITLIEADKRIGAANEIKVKLPYSKKEFGVPSNIDIYGTMNTADRSVEALDTALRRRFSFKELLPDPAIVTQKGFTDYPRVAIMEQINNRIELLLDKNHTLGHAYFIKADFEHSFKNEIIPLLQEYFYNDAGKLGLILGKGFVRAKALTTATNPNIFADFDTKNEIDIVKSYELIPFEEVEFKTALATLLAYYA